MMDKKSRKKFIHSNKYIINRNINLCRIIQPKVRDLQGWLSQFFERLGVSSEKSFNTKFRFELIN